MALFKGYRRSIIFDCEYSQVTQGTTEINKQMALLNAEFRRASEEVKQTGNSFDALSIKQEKLTTQLKLQTDKVSVLKKELNEVTNAEGNNEKAIARKTIELKNAETQLIKTQSQLNSANREVERASTALGQAGLAITDFRNNADKMGINLANVESGLLKVIGATTAAIAATTSMSMSFDKEFAKVKTIADETQVSFEDLRQGTLDMSNEINISANDLASGLYEIVSANISTADSMSVLRQSALLAKTGFTDMKTSTDIMTTVLNAYRLSVDESANVTDKLITIQKLGKTTINDLGSDFGRVAGLAATAKVSLDEMGAAISVLTVNGVNSAESITALKAILSNVVKPTKEASDIAKELGINFSISSLQAKGFDGFLADIQKRCKGNTEDMAKLFGSTEALNAVLMLTSKEGLKQFNDNLGIIGNSGGTADEALGNLDNTGERLSESWNKMKTTLTEVGDAFGPLIDVIAKTLELVSKLPPELIVTIGTFMMVYKVIGLISSILPVLAASSTMAATGLTALGIAGGLSSRQIIMIAGAIALLVGMIALLTRGSKEAEGAIKGVGNAANEAVNGSISKTQQAAQQAVNGASRKSYAIGTQYHTGGDAAVHANEEVIIPNLPRGTRVRSELDTRNDRINGINNSNVEALLTKVLSRMDAIDRSIQMQPDQMQMLARSNA